jgi:hypothetical protein
MAVLDLNLLVTLDVLIEECRVATLVMRPMGVAFRHEGAVRQGGFAQSGGV